MKHEKEKVQELWHVLGTIMDKQDALIAEMLAALKHIKEFSDLFCTACERESLINVIPGKSIHAPKCQEITDAIAKAEGDEHAAD